MFLLVISIIAFAHLLWLGLYIVSRTTREDGPRIAGMGLVLLAVALAARSIGYQLSTETPGYDAVAHLSLLLSFAWLLDGAIQARTARWERSIATWSGRALSAVPTAVAMALFLVSVVLDVQIGLVTFFACSLVYLAVGGALIARYVRDKDESLVPDVLKSCDYSLLIAALFGGQVVLAMWLSTGVVEAMLLLLFGTLSAAITMQVFLDRVQGFLDHIAFANLPWLRRERAELRKVASTLPRVNMTDPLTMDEDEFARLTRRALGDFSDLTKLATSPLTNLPEVHRRLAERDIEPTTLERARELKLILTEAIEQLKPRTAETYGTTDEWRFYNALYYPYIVGMRPYSRRATNSFDDASHWEVLEWFRTYVPERTLYNWQNAASGLIAAHLREQEVGAAAILPEVVAAGSRE